MIIKPYGDLPRMYAPDVGEVIEARRTPADKYVRAVVLSARRNREGHVRVKLQWMEDDPDAGSRNRAPIEAGTLGWVIVDDGPPLIRQINRGTAPES